MSLFTKKETLAPTSLAIAFFGLMGRFGRSAELDQITKFLSEDYNEDDWGIISDLDHTIQVLDSGHYGTWPTDDNAVVKFQYQDVEEPYVVVDGERVANIIDHYCLMHNAGEHAFIDSADGTIKSNDPYGLPLGWATYEFVENPQVVEEPEDEKKTSGRWYKLRAGESIWQVALRFKLNSAELIEHNGISNPHELAEGAEIHLPLEASEQKPRETEYHLLRHPRRMHVVREGGTHKQGFGNAKKWSDIKDSGPLYKYGDNIEIVAEAHVPIGEETALYYMTSVNLGDYPSTGRVTSTVGFNHSHLEDGIYEEALIAQDVQEQENRPLKVSPEPQAVEKSFLEERSQDFQEGTGLMDFTLTYMPFEDGERTYLATEPVRVHDYETKRPDRLLRAHSGVIITGTFEYKDQLFGRPRRGKDSWHWYGIPMEKLILEDEMFTPPVITLPEKVAIKQPLSLEERGVVLLSRALGQGTQITAKFKKLKKKIT
jgi:LysM repeat protein